MAEVVLVDPEAAGLDAMIAGLLGAAAGTPKKAAVLDRMRGSVTITVPDAEVEVGLAFVDGGVCRVHGGPIPGSQVHLTMPSDVLLSLPTVPLLLGLPSVLSPGGRDFALKLLRGQVRIDGLTHLTLLRQLTTVLALD